MNVENKHYISYPSAMQMLALGLFNCLFTTDIVCVTLYHLSDFLQLLCI